MSREEKNRIAYNYLSKYSGLDFIIDCYESEHTLSIDDAVEDMHAICKRNGGELE